MDFGFYYSGVRVKRRRAKRIQGYRYLTHKKTPTPPGTLDLH